MKKKKNIKEFFHLSQCRKWIKDIYNKLKDIYIKISSKIPPCIKDSFAFAFVKALFLILVLTTFIYLIKPSQAFITGTISQLDSYSTSFIADSVFFESSDCTEISFYSEEPIRINLKNCEIEECRSGDPRDQWLVIYPEESNGRKICGVLIRGQISVSRLYGVCSENLQKYNIFKSECSFVGPQSIHILSGRCTIETSEGKVSAEIGKDMIYLNLIEREYFDDWGLDIFPGYSPDYLDPSNSYKAIIESCSSIDSLQFYRNREHVNPPIYTELFYNDGYISVGSIFLLNSVVTSDLNISFTPTPNEYHLVMQDLKLESRLKPYPDLQLKYDSLNTKGSISGYVTYGEISKMSLFPSLRTWFFSNAYMAPTAIVSIVIAAIALFKKKKNQE